ncbi:MAG: fumarylacetoacetate hydrolase family protein [Nitrososphaerota archaeon]|nr:fumarylacetoacetate hydrolase family protein [Nitrososphaerota archaeon]
MPSESEVQIMKLLSFRAKGDEDARLGLLLRRGIVDVGSAYRLVYGEESVPRWLRSMRALLSAGEEAMEFVRRLGERAERVLDEGPQTAAAVLKDPADVEFLPPVPDPQKIVCVAVNYHSHGREMSVEVPERPYFFAKFANALVGHGSDVLIPRTSTKVDYEVELAVVIGRRAKYVSRREAEEVIAGYTVFNDVSFRDKQIPPGWPQRTNRFGFNWVHGKSLDTAAPCGPYLVTKDEVGSPYPLRLTLRVNGELRQDGTTEDMVFKVGELIEHLSDGLTLMPGDILATGTPAGVAAAGREFLKHGDVVEAEIERIGLLMNRMVREV